MKSKSFIPAVVICLLTFSVSGESLWANVAFEPGQVWSYKARPQEPDSKLTILRIDENIAGKTVVHIAIDGLKIEGPNGIVLERLGHAPIELSSLQGSVTKLVGKTDVSQLDMSGYKQWREQSDAGSAGFFTISVTQIVAHIEMALREGR